MNFRFFTRFIALAAIVLFFSGCEEDAPASKSVKEYLTNNSSKEWEVVEAKVKVSNNSQLDLMASRPACDTDNLLTFNTDYTYKLTEGATKCNTNDPDVLASGSWQLDATETTLSVDKFVFSSYEFNNPQFKLTSVNDKLFSGEIEITVQGELYTGTFTFSAVN